MKPQLIIALAIFALIVAGTMTAHAYTYTCEEGKFQIDVPEGWEVAEDNLSTEYVCLVALAPKEYYMSEIKVVYLDKSQFKRQFGFEYNSVEELHMRIIKLLEVEYTGEMMDNYISKEEAIRMNIDYGFILRLDDDCIDYLAYFMKGNYVYVIVSHYDKESEKEPMDIFIKILNNFEVLD